MHRVVTEKSRCAQGPAVLEVGGTLGVPPHNVLVVVRYAPPRDEMAVSPCVGGSLCKRTH